MNKETFWKSIVSFGLCFALVAPFMNVAVKAQEGNAKLVTRLQNRSKLRVEATKFVNSGNVIVVKRGFRCQGFDIGDCFVKFCGFDPEF